MLDRRQRLGHFGRGQPGLLEFGGKPCGEQDLVARAQRDVEIVGQPDDQVAARLRAPGLDKAEVPGRHLDLERELQLAQTAAFAPLAQLLSGGFLGAAFVLHARETSRAR